MPRYFFNLQCEKIVAGDDKGRELDCLADAHFQAQLMIRKIESHVVEDENDSARWMIRVVNSADGTEMIVLFPVKRAVSEKRNILARWKL